MALFPWRSISARLIGMEFHLTYEPDTKVYCYKNGVRKLASGDNEKNTAEKPGQSRDTFILTTKAKRYYHCLL